jgi:hypothetical protein
MPFPLPYLKLAGIAVILFALGFAYWKISSAFDERNELRISDAAKTAQVKQYQEAEVQNAKIRDDINAAISKIRVTSNNYIKAVDGQKPPVIPDGTIVQLVPGGMLENVPRLSAYTNYSGNSPTPDTEAH